MILVSWNIAGLRHASLESVGALIKAQKPTVVCLQEVGKSCSYLGGLDQARLLAKYCGLENVAYSSYQPFANLNGTVGNAILANWPIVDTEVLNLSLTAHTPNRRTAVKVVLNRWWARKQTTVICAHLNGGDADHANAERILHINEIDTLLEKGYILADCNHTPERLSAIHARTKWVQMNSSDIFTTAHDTRDFGYAKNEEFKNCQIIQTQLSDHHLLRFEV